MIIREATLEDLPNLSACAAEFHAATKVLKAFHIEKFCKLWTTFIEGGIGVIFLLCDDAGQIAGTIGGIVHEDAYGDDLIAQEFFWYVLKGSRGGGIALFNAFVAWARERGCARLRVGYLVDSMPQKVERFYERLGLQFEEKVYAISLKE